MNLNLKKGFSLMAKFMFVFVLLLSGCFNKQNREDFLQPRVIVTLPSSLHLKLEEKSAIGASFNEYELVIDNLDYSYIKTPGPYNNSFLKISNITPFQFEGVNETMDFITFKEISNGWYKASNWSENSLWSGRFASENLDNVRGIAYYYEDGINRINNDISKFYIQGENEFLTIANEQIETKTFTFVLKTTENYEKIKYWYHSSSCILLKKTRVSSEDENINSDDFILIKVSLYKTSNISINSFLQEKGLPPLPNPYQDLKKKRFI